MRALNTESSSRCRTCRSAIVLCAAAISIAAAASGCGKGSDSQPEGNGRPNSMPREQILYREAKETFNAWMQDFGAQEKLTPLYTMLSASALSALRSEGVTNAEMFASWFNGQQAIARHPFFYRFSRLNVLDVDLRDTNRAILTATFMVDMPTGGMESVGSFYLLREKNRWKVPFGAGADWIKSWWQQERVFTGKARNKDLAHTVSGLLEIEVEYPVTWDAADKRQFRVPGDNSVQTGLELAYRNPVTQESEVVVRIWAVPLHLQDSATIEPGSHREPTIESRTPASLSDPDHVIGIHVVMKDEAGQRMLHVFGGVREAHAPYSSYQTVINAVVESIISTL